MQCPCNAQCICPAQCANCVPSAHAMPSAYAQRNVHTVCPVPMHAIPAPPPVSGQTRAFTGATASQNHACSSLCLWPVTYGHF
eukprot:scaffold17846_cov22-Tisochrysis_lutea.AAC.1